jgi:hypothetical protein
MTTLYSVVQYVPDPIANERVNIGVAIFAGNGPKFRFVSRLDKARSLGREGLGTVLDLMADVRERNFGPLGAPENWSFDKLGQLLGKWQNTVQFTPPRASTKDADLLLGELAELFLHDRGDADTLVESPEVVGHSTAAREVKKAVKDALATRLGSGAARQLLRSNAPLQGRSGIHDFDIAIVNGSPLVAARAISFRVKDDARLRNAVDAAAFAISDVTKVFRKIKAALVYIPPTQSNTEAFERAKSLGKKLHIPLVDHTESANWATRVVRGISAASVGLLV